MNEGIEPGDVWSIGNVPDAPMPELPDELPPPSPPKRRMLQPTKDRLRQALTDSANRIEAQGAEILRLKEQLIGEGKAALAGLVVGVLVGWVFL